MNERIKQLAIKHNLLTEGMIGSFYTEGMIGSFYMDALNKFAEELMAPDLILFTALQKQRDSFMQIITDPENQPTQYGTVTLEYMEREIAKEREACAKEREKREAYDRLWIVGG
jgi:hypothetical protein